MSDPLQHAFTTLRRINDVTTMNLRESQKLADELRGIMEPFLDRPGMSAFRDELQQVRIKLGNALREML